MNTPQYNIFNQYEKNSNLLLCNNVDLNRWLNLSSYLNNFKNNLAVSVNTGIAGSPRACKNIITAKVKSKNFLAMGKSKLLFGAEDYSAIKGTKNNYNEYHTENYKDNLYLSLSNFKTLTTGKSKKKVLFISGAKSYLENQKKDVTNYANSGLSVSTVRLLTSTLKNYNPDIIISNDFPEKILKENNNYYKYPANESSFALNEVLNVFQPKLWVVLNKYCSKNTVISFGQTIFHSVKSNDYICLEIN